MRTADRKKESYKWLCMFRWCPVIDVSNSCITNRDLMTGGADDMPEN